MSAQMNDHQEAVKNLMAERYLLGELNAGEREAYEEHLFSCDTCFEQVKAGTEFVGHLRRMGAEEAAARPHWSQLIYRAFRPSAALHFGFDRVFDRVKAGTVLVDHLRQMEEAAARPHWSQLIYRAFRPSAALAFGIMFLCTAGLSVRQAMVIHRMNAPEEVMVVTVKDSARASDMPINVPRGGSFELRTSFSYDRKLQSYTARVVGVSGKEITPPVAIRNPEAGEVQLLLHADQFRDGDYILIVQAIDQTTHGIRVLGQSAFQLRLQD